MRHLTDAVAPAELTVDDVEFKSLYRKTEYEAQTSDGWTLVVTRYQPVPRPFFQPIFGEPLLLVHGFCQNRHAWTSGQFVKNLLFFGADIHILELRGHGKSSRELQLRRSQAAGLPPPADLDYAWDIDSYFLHDLPAAVGAVKAVTGRERIFFCGHSMGGMIGYGYAGLHDDFEGIVTIGASSEMGKGFPLLRLIAAAEPFLGGAIDGGLAAGNVARQASHVLTGFAGRSLRRTGLHALADRVGPASLPPTPYSFRYLPTDDLVRWVESAFTTGRYSTFREITAFLTILANPSRATSDDVRWLMRHGVEREPRGVVTQFARWIRRRDLVCYRTGYDFKSGFGNITVPMAIIFGDLDKLASMKSTAGIYRRARSEYLLWRPVKGNSHVELTMGHDIRQICYDIKNLIDFARKHRGRRPSLPRLEGDASPRR
ncbi:alpha/beta fold hydrolase [Vulgatibacter incomptus]|uniref:Polyhydroxyalkanoic acid synthase n=1 Tax=Vulgatibacter incomptus TaxID=1391653 RepID=A0A0K1P8Y8_9BACT|nr:alpha/beta fold hydrolase [Vulgatibacter incomptus]AKU89876.1 Polyhydroxyalkanoic acid synthase [Vulgatibacter incomptus]